MGGSAEWRMWSGWSEGISVETAPIPSFDYFGAISTSTALRTTTANVLAVQARIAQSSNFNIFRESREF
ncbi:MAG: hypothetical protein AAF497_21925, partial [Planctomycetota bacterium]